MNSFTEVGLSGLYLLGEDWRVEKCSGMRYDGPRSPRYRIPRLLNRSWKMYRILFLRFLNVRIVSVVFSGRSRVCLMALRTKFASC